MRRIRFRTSASIFGRPGFFRDFHRQYSLKPWRCHRTIVPGWTMSKADLQPVHRRDSQHNKTRSVRRSLRRGTDRCRTISCWRRARFSAAGAARLPKSTLRNAHIIRSMPISVPPSLVGRPESYGESLLLAMIVSAVESSRTRFSGWTMRACSQVQRRRPSARVNLLLLAANLLLDPLDVAPAEGFDLAAQLEIAADMFV